jgi:hypothetical protein
MKLNVSEVTREGDVPQDAGSGGFIQPAGRAAAVLRAIGIANLDPPAPPTPGQTAM